MDLLAVHGSVTDRNLVESFHDAIQARDELMHLFSLGYVSLPMRAAGAVVASLGVILLVGGLTGA